MELYARRTRGAAGMETSRKNKTWFPVIGVDRKTHETILSYLAERCTDLWRVTITCRSEYSQPYAVEDCITSRTTEEQEDGRRIIAHCRVSKELFHALGTYENFFKIENKGDISIYDGDTCLLWMVGHHHNLWLNPVFFSDCASLIQSEKALYAYDRYFSDYAYCTSNALAYGLELQNREHARFVFQALAKCGGTFLLEETEYQNCRESVAKILEFETLPKITFLKDGAALAYTIPEKNTIVLDEWTLLSEYMIILDPEHPYVREEESNLR